MSKDAKIVILKNCDLPKVTYKHIADQLHVAEQLELLYLEGINNLPVEFGRAVGKLAALRGLYITKCEIEASVFKTIAEQLQVCDKLQVLSLRVTQGVPVELGEAVNKMTFLTELYVSVGWMRLAVSNAVLKDASKCLSLKDLDLSFNTLTDCVANFLGDNDHPGFHSLDRLILW